MADLDVVGQRDILHFDTERRSGRHAIPNATPYALLGLPLSEKLDFLSKLGDVLREGWDGGHFVLS